MSNIPRHEDEGLDSEVSRLERELLAHGLQGQRELLNRPDMLSAEQAEARTGISAAALRQLRIEGRVLGLELPNGKGGYKFPAFQFDPEIRSAIPGILQAFGRGAEWKAYDFLTLPEPLLGGRTVLDELRAGHLEPVMRAAVAAAALGHGAY
ncbi:hypothetical protein [Azoarcus sp. KH32C]|uniref:hypothetical protein n=1 Tax=Azoarcus sp. KH32C TaxID=748247 RepID=UPI0002385FBF|nr:hypothetical protein [Azoarcus sp. KH32C]BAL23482.1 hypothetical protein AZKH_1153 [Azoarcus sp. KH32C]